MPPRQIPREHIRVAYKQVLAHIEDIASAQEILVVVAPERVDGLLE